MSDSSFTLVMPRSQGATGSAPPADPAFPYEQEEHDEIRKHWTRQEELALMRSVAGDDETILNLWPEEADAKAEADAKDDIAEQEFLERIWDRFGLPDDVVDDGEIIK